MKSLKWKWANGWHWKVKILTHYSDTTHLSHNGVFYKGEMKGGKPHGRGNSRHQDGDTYSGDWKGGMFHGYGVYTW